MKISSVKCNRLTTFEFAIFPKRIIRQTFIHSHEFLLNFVDFFHITFVQLKMGFNLLGGKVLQRSHESGKIFSNVCHKNKY